MFAYKALDSHGRLKYPRVLETRQERVIMQTQDNSRSIVPDVIHNIGINKKEIQSVDEYNTIDNCKIGTIGLSNYGYRCIVNIIELNNYGYSCKLNIVKGDNHGHRCYIDTLQGDNYGNNCKFNILHGKNYGHNCKLNGLNLAVHTLSVEEPVTRDHHPENESLPPQQRLQHNETHQIKNSVGDDDKKPTAAAVSNCPSCLICGDEDVIFFRLLCHRIDADGDKVTKVCEGTGKTKGAIIPCGFDYCQKCVNKLSECPQCKTTDFDVMQYMEKKKKK
jgi:hypothetical protein